MIGNNITFFKVGLGIFWFIIFIILYNFSGKYYYNFQHESNYTYLFAGLNTSLFHSSGLFYHPGTPIHYFAGLILILFRIFIYNDINYINFVIDNSELLIFIIVLSFVIVFVIANILLFESIYLTTGSILIAISSQLFYFFIPDFWINFNRLGCESGLIICSILLLKDKILPFKNRLIVLLIFLIAVFSKIPFVVFLPLFFEKKWLSLKYIGFALIFILFLSLPIVFDIHRLFRWYYFLFLGTNSYGTGDHTVFSFINILSIIKKLLIEYYAYLIILICFVLINYKSKNTYFWVFTHLLFILFISKSPANRYFLPLLILSYFFFYVTVSHCFNFKLKQLKYFFVLLGGCALSFFYNDLKSINRNTQYNIEYSNAIDKLPLDSVIFNDFVPFRAYWLYDGNSYQRGAYFNILNKKLPELYVKPWDSDSLRIIGKKIIKPKIVNFYNYKIKYLQYHSVNFIPDKERINSYYWVGNVLNIPKNKKVKLIFKNEFGTIFKLY